MHLHIHQPYRGGKELGRDRRNEWSTEKASRRTQIKRSIYFLKQKLKKGLCTIPHPHPLSQRLLMGHCLPLCFSALCSSHTWFVCSHQGSCSDPHTNVCPGTQEIPFLSFSAFALHAFLPLCPHVPHGEPGFDMVQLKTHINDELLA